MGKALFKGSMMEMVENSGDLVRKWAGVGFA